MKTLISFIIVVCSTIPISAQWYPQTSGTTAHLMSVDFVNNEVGWIAGTSGVIKGTTNSGQTWENTSTTHVSPLCTYYSICFPTIDKGYACGYVTVNGFNMRNWASTENGGGTWSWPMSWGFPAGRFYSVFFVNDSIGWRVGTYGFVTKITAGASGFTTSNLADHNTPLYSIHFIDENKGWVAGYDGYIAKSTDGGNNWNALASGITDHFKSIFFISSSKGWAVGDRDDIGVIIKTTDGGETWYQVNYPPMVSISQIQFVNDSIGWACGSKIVEAEEKGVILYTDDGGENWTEQYISNGSKKICSLFFLNELTGWVVGYDGIILKTTNAGGTSNVAVDEDLLSKYSLSNNYPNPFHSETIIRYTIPRKEKVLLQIFDLSGKGIAMLVDEEKTSGSYEVTFNPSRLTGGIYFYKLSAGDFTQTKKMLSLK